MPDKFKNRYLIASTRLPDWNYSDNGAYFLTICTAHREHYFGEIVNSEMHLSIVGQFVNECWKAIPNHFPYFFLDLFQIMPNHIHGIIVINKLDSNNISVFDVAVETGHALSLQQQTNADKQTTKPAHFRFRNQGRNTISAAIGSFKSAVTKYCNENQMESEWQPRFHDHVIQDPEEFYSIRNYIINNPRNWKDDRFY
jgi:REP element-mobilizing transposase RayT